MVPFEHFKSLKSSLSQTLLVIRRVAREIPRSKLMTVVHSLWVSKLRYGLQLYILTNNDAFDPSLCLYIFIL